MGFYRGTNISTDGLLFGYNADNNSRFYKGEPTTNIIPDPLFLNSNLNTIRDEVNGGWGTTTRCKVEDVLGPDNKYIRAYSMELINAVSGNTNMQASQHYISSNSFTLISGTTYTISIYAKGNVNTTSTNRIYMTGPVAISDISRTITTEWGKITKTFTATVTGTYFIYSYCYSAPAIGTKIWYTKPQIEAKDHVTNFVVGTRPSNRSLIDLTGNNSIDLPSVSFDSNSMPYFDGINDSIAPGNITLTSTGTISVWVKSNRSYPSDSVSTQFRGIVGKVSGGGAGQQSYYIDWYGTNTTRILRFGLGDSTSAITVIVSQDLSNWTNIVARFDGSTIDLFVNNILVGSAAQTKNAQIIPNSLNISGFFGIWDGYINDVRIYNKALTNIEIQQNYNALKGKFN